MKILTTVNANGWKKLFFKGFIYMDALQRYCINNIELAKKVKAAKNRGTDQHSRFRSKPEMTCNFLLLLLFFFSVSWFRASYNNKK